MINIPGFMHELSHIRPIFHSEADFQHAFAWELHKSMPDLNVRLEYPWNTGVKQNHLDIFAFGERSVFAYELKYKTKKLIINVDGEQYSLRDQLAPDHGRYDVLKDITRLEQLSTNYQNFNGFVILLSNDSVYWNKPNKPDAIDVQFRMHDGCELSGELGWGIGASAGTIQGREHLLNLRSSFKVRWEDYSKPSDKPNSRFRYLAFKIENMLNNKKE
jgi:hypothetical protein